jgi:hypothetical protein
VNIPRKPVELRDHQHRLVQPAQAQGLGELRRSFRLPLSTTISPPFVNGWASGRPVRPLPGRRVCFTPPDYLVDGMQRA